MASAADLITILGFPAIVQGDKFTVLASAATAPSFQPSSEDLTQARPLLVQARTTDPSYRDVYQKKRYLFHSKQKKLNLSNPANWRFTSSEIGRSLDLYFDEAESTRKPIGVARALLGMGIDHSAARLWQLSQEHRSKWGITIDSLPKSNAACPWLDRAVESRQLPMVSLLCQAGMDQPCLNRALERALRLKEYAIAEELLRFRAEMPSDEELYSAALCSPRPDLTFIKLWLSAPLRPDRQYAINAMFTAAGTPLPTDEMKTALSVLLANVQINADEAHQLLQCAIGARNIEAVAAVTLAVDGTWTHMQSEGGASAIMAAVQIDDCTLRYRVVNFLLSAGAKADTTTLRQQLLKDGKSGLLGHIRLLIDFGVSPCQPGSDMDLLSWAVVNANMDVFNIVMEADIPPEVASAAVDKIPRTATDEAKVSMVTGLGNKGASGLPLSRLLLQAVQSSNEDLTRALVAVGASADYIDSEGANSLYVAVVRGDVMLARLLCTANPTPSIVSAAVRLTFDALMNNSVDTMLEILSLLAQEGAKGDPVECTLIRAIPTTACLSVLQILLPTGLSLAAGGRAVNQAIRLPSTEVLELICTETNCTAQSLETALREVIYGTHYSFEKALVLARMARRLGYSSALDWILANPMRKRHPNGEQIIDMLLSHGANVDVGGGVLLVDALDQGNKEALSKLLRWNPSASSLTTALGAVCHAKTKDLGFEFSRILLDASDTDIGQSRTLLQLVQEVDPEAPDQELVSLLLDYNASVDYANGEVLYLAAKGLLFELAEALLAREASVTTVERAFRAALTSLEPSSARLAMMELLLKSGVRVDTASQALVEEIESKPEDLDTSMLLMTYNASVNSHNGLALTQAIKLGLYEHVRLLSSCPEGLNQEVANQALRTATESDLGHDLRAQIYQLLFSHPIDQNEKDAALLAACTSKEHEDTVAILLRNGASIEFRNGKALVSVVEGGNESLLQTILMGSACPPSNGIMKLAFQAALRLSNPARLETCKALIHQGIDPETRSAHLIDAIQKQDPDLLALILSSGPVMWNVDKESLKYAVAHELPREVELLVQHDVPDQAIATAFNHLLQHKSFFTSGQVDIAAQLLSIGLDQEVRNSALYRALSHSSLELPTAFIKLLLDNDADPATCGGMCFGLAAKKHSREVFEELTARPFDLNLALRSLIEYLQSEPDLCQWIELCVKQHQNTGAMTENDDSLLRFLIERFPDGRGALSLLLDQHYDPGYVFMGENDVEELTLLMWALSKKGAVSDQVMVELLSRGRLAKPAFTCRDSGLSAVHLAALHDRPEVLRHLIELHVDIDFEETTGKTPLYLATESCNMDCMAVLLHAGARPDDGSMHVAARRADAESISLLKQHGHDVMFPMDRFSGRTPLAEMCLNASGLGPRWARSMQEAMKLLMPFPPPTWKFDGKTVLHLAIDNPDAALPIMSSFLYLSRVRENPDKDDDYLFVDDKGLRYSPTMYVDRLCPSKSAQEKKELTRSLATHRFIDRYFAESGTQPPYATGLPKALRDAIIAEKQADWKHQQELRRVQVLAERQQKVTEEMNAKTLQHQDLKDEREVDMIRRRGDARVEEQRRAQSLSYAHQQSLQDLKFNGDRRGAEQALELDLKRGQELGRQKLTFSAQQYMMEQAHTRELHKAQQQHLRLQMDGQRRDAELALARDKRREKEVGKQKLAYAAQQYMMEQAHSGVLREQKQRQIGGRGESQRMTGRKPLAAIEWHQNSDRSNLTNGKPNQEIRVEIEEA